MRGQIADRSSGRFLRRGALQRDREFRRIEQEHAIAGDTHLAILHVGEFEARFDSGDPVIIGRLPPDRKRAIGLRGRIIVEGDLRRIVGDERDRPLGDLLVAVEDPRRHRACKLRFDLEGLAGRLGDRRLSGSSTGSSPASAG